MRASLVGNRDLKRCGGDVSTSSAESFAYASRVAALSFGTVSGDLDRCLASSVARSCKHRRRAHHGASGHLDTAREPRVIARII
ncbi:hypothetical protein TRAPUB_198 [Trametes pubescens]|uniref:Uncharacterized protein n=1 Tax=Trametes pubescens TaxID=154538 RepID=A0A1M2VMS5_TRAPU|nr:hypothetical protein TRAPUB_198 [Trametes pubescens]